MMKTMKMMSAALLLALAMTACNNRDEVIDVKDLPAAAQDCLNAHFGDKKVTMAQKDSETFGVSYDVVFSDGTKLEFDDKGEWTEIDTKPQTVPAALVPQAIAEHVATNYPDASIVKIEREDKGYEVELTNRLELRFDDQFNAVGVDD